MNYKLEISYDGSRYNGWQKQGNTKNTIQGKIEEVIDKLMFDKVEGKCELQASGRTDAGVHALCQVANVHLETFIDTEMFRNELNKYLPMDIRINKVEKVDGRFHARLNAKGKHYRYTIDNGDVQNVFLRKYSTRIEEKLNIDKMIKAAELIEGEHDFRAFCTKPNLKKSTVRKISKIDIIYENEMLNIDVYGNGFLYNMVRIICGTLIEVGKGERKPEDISNIFELGDRKNAGFTAPAEGLFLYDVFY